MDWRFKRSLACSNLWKFECKKDFSANHKLGKYTPDNNATCEEDGTQSAICSICGYKDSIPVSGTKKGHSFGVYTSNHDATCEEDGTKSATCKNCGKTDTIKDPKTAKGHFCSSDWTSDETNHWHAALCEHSDLLNSLEAHRFDNWISNKDSTCTEDGTKSRKCRICGYIETVSEQGSANGHTFPQSSWYGRGTEYTSNNDATCTEDGTKYAICKICGYVETVADEGSAKGHKSDKGTVTKKATTEEEGEKIYKCITCDQVIKNEVLPKLYAFHETVENVMNFGGFVIILDRAFFYGVWGICDEIRGIYSLIIG